MSRDKPSSLVASVANRLLQRARRTGEDNQVLLTRYGLERLMYRLSCSDVSDRFIVKEAMLFLVWSKEPFRVTRDLDLLATHAPSRDDLLQLFESLCNMEVEDDGVVFDTSTIQVSEIREDQPYGGLRVTLLGRLGKIRIPIQVDVGFGDAVTPEPMAEPFPVLLDFDPPMLRLYPKETVVAEKVDAIVQLGLANSRMKDYYDLWVLMREFEFDGALLQSAILATFKRRKTPLPSGEPPGLTNEFAGDRRKQTQWSAFVRRTHLVLDANIDLKMVVDGIKTFVLPPIIAAEKSKPFNFKWRNGGPWAA